MSFVAARGTGLTGRWQHQEASGARHALSWLLMPVYPLPKLEVVSSHPLASLTSEGRSVQTPEGYTPGYPIDLRRSQQVAQLHKGVLGDFERVAARVVARFTGAQTFLQDDGTRDGMVDIRVERPEPPPIYVEVWTDVSPAYASTYSRLLKRGGGLPQRVPITGLRRNWQVTVAGSSDLRALEAELPDLLIDLETRGQVFRYVAGLERLRLHLSRSVQRLLRLGVVGLCSGRQTSKDPGVVSLYPDGIEGPSVVDWEPVVNWIDESVISPRLHDVRAKLARTAADERHVFMGVTFTTPGSVFFALDSGERTLPPKPPSLPDEITHLWLMRPASGGRCLAWFPDRGWLDVRRHWATA